MTKWQRIASLALSGILLLSGFAFGRMSKQSAAAAANEDRQAQVPPTPLSATGNNLAASPVYRAQPVVYRNASRPVYYERKHQGSSKMRTALTIAAPAAVGAGVGALVGGKKGAGVGALLGGGGGAIYYLSKNRR